MPECRGAPSKSAKAKTNPPQTLHELREEKLEKKHLWIRSIRALKDQCRPPEIRNSARTRRSAREHSLGESSLGTPRQESLFRQCFKKEKKIHRKSSEESKHWQSSADRKAAEGWPRNVGYVNQRFQACYGTLSHDIGPDIQLAGRQTNKAREFRIQVLTVWWQVPTISHWTKAPKCTRRSRNLSRNLKFHMY
jgi:hypothetical protein